MSRFVSQAKHLKKINYLLVILAIVSSWSLYFSVDRRENLPIDYLILTHLEVRQNYYLNLFSKFFYYFGSVYCAGTISAICLAILIWRRYKQEALAFIFATLGILIVVDNLLKPFFDRRRPPKPRLVEDLSRDSFPSGHAAGNLVLYFYIAFIVGVKYPHLKIYIYSLATIIVVLIGFASLHTKAHWLTDVLGGYMFGYLWLILSLNLLNFIQKSSDIRGSNIKK
ncbi:MAG: phosphatase PAP2 family protein [Pleurocapsa sp.]